MRASVTSSCVSWGSHMELAGHGGTTVPIVHCHLGDLQALYAVGEDPLLPLMHFHGAVMLRGLDLADVDGFRALVTADGRPSLSYDFGSTPRSKVRAGVFSSTEYPATETIPQHNEQSYTTQWPGRIWFYCAVPPADGGATPLADSRVILSRLDPDVRGTFKDRGLAYVRNMGTGLDVPWQAVFGTSERTDVECYCRDHDIAWQWLGDEQLRTRQICQVEIDHPHTGERLWFNQAHLFHISGLQPSVRESLLAVVDEEDLPRNVYFGDGSSIPDDMLDAVRTAYDSCTLSIPWHQGDVLVLDNMLMTHGREPFNGPRQVLVAMTEPYRFDNSTNRVLAVNEPTLPQEVVS